MFYVYMLTNRWNNVLYTGMTDSIDGRISDHRNGRFENSLTKKYNCTKLVYIEEVTTAAGAALREMDAREEERPHCLNEPGLGRPCSTEGILRFAQDLRP